MKQFVWVLTLVFVLTASGQDVKSTEIPGLSIVGRPHPVSASILTYTISNNTDRRITVVVHCRVVHQRTHDGLLWMAVSGNSDPIVLAPGEVFESKSGWPHTSKKDGKGKPIDDKLYGWILWATDPIDQKTILTHAEFGGCWALFSVLQNSSLINGQKLFDTEGNLSATNWWE